MKVLQANLGRAWIAHDLAFAAAAENNIDLLMISEVNKTIAKKAEWICDIRVDTAVYCRNKNIGITGYAKFDGAVQIQLAGFDIYCCYISPNISLADFKKDIDNIMEEILTRNREAIVLGDLNAKSPAWGSPIEDARGAYLTEWAAVIDLVALNRGNIPTFVRGNSKSFIDITLATLKTAGDICNWRVSEEESFSLHRFIFFEVKTATDRNRTARNRARHSIDNRKMEEVLRSTLTEQDIAKTLYTLRNAQDDSSLTAPNNARSASYWWNADIAKQREACNKHRRIITRARRSGTINDNMIRDYKSSRKTLKDLINTSKRLRWRELCAELENDIWGQGYKIAMKGIQATSFPYEIGPERRAKIITELFPKVADNWIRHESIAEAPPFTIEELQLAYEKLKTGKAAGPDKILPDTIRKAVEVAPTVILKLLNQLLMSQRFPPQWKRARVVLIPKGKGENVESTSSYRPICVLDAMGKLYEILIRERLVAELDSKRAISDRQYGFRKGYCTTHALQWVTDAVERSNKKWCAFITLDVKNAFNTARWSIIIKNLKNLEVSNYLINLMENYFCGRTVETSEGFTSGVSAGVPQGSIIGPTLWNVMYDKVLNIELPDNCHTIAYADDLGLFAEADYKEDLCLKTDIALLLINNWMTENHLELAPHKTEAVIFKGKRNRADIVFNIGITQITPQKSVKYLGIWLDENLTFSEHVKQIKTKAENRVAALSRVMPNIGGPSFEKRKVLAGVAKSIIMYGAPIWGKALSSKKNRDLVESIQRKSLLRVTSAYRTTSIKALQVIAGVLPIDIQVEEAMELYQASRQADQRDTSTIRARSVTKWQARWTETAEVAQWTKQLINNIEPWLNCAHRTTDYYLTQFLTGHGSFRTFTHRIGKRADEYCIYCGAVDTPAHTIFECPRWVIERTYFETNFGGVLDVQSITQQMISSKTNWRKIHLFIGKVMRKKEFEERQARA